MSEPTLPTAPLLLFPRACVLASTHAYPHADCLQYLYRAQAARPAAAAAGGVNSEDEPAEMQVLRTELMAACAHADCLQSLHLAPRRQLDLQQQQREASAQEMSQLRAEMQVLRTELVAAVSAREESSKFLGIMQVSETGRRRASTT